MIRDFCEDAAAFLGGGEGRTVAVHCKAGRGRTGLMLCAYLLHSVRFRMLSQKPLSCPLPCQLRRGELCAVVSISCAGCHR